MYRAYWTTLTYEPTKVVGTITVFHRVRPLNHFERQEGIRR